MGKALSAGSVRVAYTRPLKFWKGDQTMFMLLLVTSLSFVHRTLTVTIVFRRARQPNSGCGDRGFAVPTRPLKRTAEKRGRSAAGRLPYLFHLSGADDGQWTHSARRILGRRDSGSRTNSRESHQKPDPEEH